MMPWPLEQQQPTINPRRQGGGRDGLVRAQFTPPTWGSEGCVRAQLTPPPTWGHSGVLSVMSHTTMPQSLRPTGREERCRRQARRYECTPGPSTSSSASTRRPEGGTEPGSPGRG